MHEFLVFPLITQCTNVQEEVIHRSAIHSCFLGLTVLKTPQRIFFSLYRLNAVRIQDKLDI